MSEIKFVVFDVDGVFTDGSFYYDENGKVLKKFGPHDGDGIKLLKKIGLGVQAISADHRGFKITKRRMQDLGISVELVSESDRMEFMSTNYSPNELVFVGDGLFDAQVLAWCKYGIAPRNATLPAKKASKFVTTAAGGDGAVSEACFHIARKFFPANFSSFLFENGLNETDF